MQFNGVIVRAFSSSPISIEICYRTKTQNEMVVGEFVMMMFGPVGYVDHFGLEIDALDMTIKDFDVLQKFPHRTDDMRNIEVAGGDLVQHRRKEKEVLAIYERDLDIRVSRKGFVEVQRSVESAKAAAEDNDLCFFIHIIAQRYESVPL